MRVVVLGASGLTGRRVLENLLDRGHQPVVVLRADPSALRAAAATVAMRGDVEVRIGDVRDGQALHSALPGSEAVLSVLETANGDVASLVAATMRTHGVRRYIGVSAAGVRVPGDRSRWRGRLASWWRHGSREESDKQREYRVWAASGLDWTLVRPAWLVDRAGESGPSPRLEHHPHRAPRYTSIPREVLARFLVDELECPRYVGAAPLVAAS